MPSDLALLRGRSTTGQRPRARLSAVTCARGRCAVQSAKTITCSEMSLSIPDVRHCPGPRCPSRSPASCASSRAMPRRGPDETTTPQPSRNHARSAETLLDDDPPSKRICASNDHTPFRQQNPPKHARQETYHRATKLVLPKAGRTGTSPAALSLSPTTHAGKPRYGIRQ